MIGGEAAEGLPEEGVTGGPRGAAAPLRHESLLLAVAFAALGVLVLLIPVVPHVGAMAMTGVLVAIATAFAFARQGRGQLDWFEVFLPFSFIYVVYFGIGTLHSLFNPEDLFSVSLRSYLEPALALAVVGFVAFTLGYVFLFARTIPSPLSSWGPRGLAAYMLPGLIGFTGELASVAQGKLLRSGAGLSGVVSTVQQFEPLFFVSWYLVWADVFGGRISRGRRLFLLALFLPMAGATLYLKIGTKLTALTLAGVPIIAFWYARRRLPIKSIVALLVVVVFVVFPIYNNFRIQRQDLGTTERLDRTLRVTREWDSNKFMEQSLGSMLRRMAIVTSVAAIIRDTGRWVEFKKGETLMLAPISVLIPRVIWPEKPEIHVGREFGVTFRLVNAIDRETQIAPSFVGEFYWNFHVPGVLVGMFLLGGLYRWVYQRYSAGASGSSFGRAMYAGLLIILLQFEGNVAVLIGALVKTLAITIATVLFLRRIGVIESLESSGADPAPGI